MEKCRKVTVVNLEIPEKCELCPRKCHANRAAGKAGFCGADDKIRVARAALHFWEEPCISGDEGSGTVFFSGCTMRCLYCQNQEISRGRCGREITVNRLSEIFLELQGKNANNINLVTPMHYLPSILKALDIARSNGLCVPIVWNTGGWERHEIISCLKDYADIWLTDFKYSDNGLAERFSSATYYFETASSALDAMVQQTGPCEFSENGMMKKGVIVRHLILPGHTDDSKKILSYLHERYGDSIWVSIMNQYTPVCTDETYPELLRQVTDDEYDDVINYAIDIGINNAFIQEGGTVSESFIPDFNCEGV